MEYWVARAGTLTELIELVKDAIAKGWRPQGGVAARGDNGIEYLQATVRTL